MKILKDSFVTAQVIGSNHSLACKFILRREEISEIFKWNRGTYNYAFERLRQIFITVILNLCIRNFAPDK